jgi:hypothetical protein
MEPAEAIAAIHAAGGIAILAHPNKNVPDLNEPELRSLIAYLKANGLDGVEGYRYEIDRATSEKFLVPLIEEMGLLVSGGSDFHCEAKDVGSDRPGKYRHPADSHSPADIWPALEARIRERGGLTNVLDIETLPAADASAAERLAFASSARRQP